MESVAGVEPEVRAQWVDGHPQRGEESRGPWALPERTSFSTVSGRLVSSVIREAHGDAPCETAAIGPRERVIVGITVGAP